MPKTHRATAFSWIFGSSAPPFIVAHASAAIVFRSHREDHLRDVLNLTDIHQVRRDDLDETAAEDMSSTLFRQLILNALTQHAASEETPYSPPGKHSG